MKLFSRLRGRDQPTNGHHQGVEPQFGARFDPSADTLCPDPAQQQYQNGRVQGVYVGPHYYGAPMVHPHAEFFLPLRVVPGMPVPPSSSEPSYQSPVEVAYGFHGDPQHVASPVGANMVTSSASTSNLPSINTEMHRRRVLGGGMSPVSPTSSTGRSGGRGQHDRRFSTNISTTFTLPDLESLRRYDLVFLLCDSPSMGQNGKWQQCGDLLLQLARVAMEYDSDGIEIHFLNTESERSSRTFKSEEEVRAMFETVVTPAGSSRLSDKLDPLICEYQSQLQAYVDSNPARRWLTNPPKKAIYIVLTDGNHSDKENLRKIIVKMAAYLDSIHAPETQFGVEFVQIGQGHHADTDREFFGWLDRGVHVEERVRDIVRADIYPGGTLDTLQLGEILLGSVSGDA